MCCTIKNKKTDLNKELNTLKNMFDEVIISQKEKYQLLTLRDKANKENYDYVVWLEVRVANSYSNGWSSTSGEELMQRVLKKLVLWVDKLKGFEISTPKQLSLFEEEIQDASSKSKIEIIKEKYSFFELFNPKYEVYTGIDHRLNLPSKEEIRELYKKAILKGMKNPGRDNDWFWFDTPEYVAVQDGLSDFELRDRLNSIRLFLVPYTEYFCCFIDDSLTDHSREDKSPEISYRYYLDGRRGLSISGPHDIETLDLPSYDDIFNAELLEWVRETLNVPVLEAISDEDILKENLEHYFNRLIAYNVDEFDYMSRINKAVDWKTFKAEITSFTKKHCIGNNGGGSGYSIDGFYGSYSIDKKGNIKITQLIEDRIALNRDVENLEVGGRNNDNVVVFDLSADEIYKKAFELFNAKKAVIELTIFDFLAA